MDAIPVDAVRDALRKFRPSYEKIFLAYADCGTGGALPAACQTTKRRSIAREST